MADETSISNLALSHIGNSKEIQNLETDRSEEASACRRFYTSTLEEILRSFAWSFSKNIEALSLIEEDPNSEWAFSYQYPSGCEKFLRILSGDRNDSRQSRVPHKIVRSSTGRIILTDKEDAEGEYTTLEDDPSFYPPDFIMAFSLLLAHYIAPRVTSGDPFKLGPRAYALYQKAWDKATANDLSEDQPDEPPQSEFISGRD